MFNQYFTEARKLITQAPLASCLNSLIFNSDAIAISFAVYDNFILLSIIFKGNPKNKSKSACMYGGFYKCIEGRA